MKTIKIHFMGIGGSGCSGAAALAQASGFQISGCDINLDLKEMPYLLKQSILNMGHNPQHLRGIDILVISPAVNIMNSHNEEIQEARRKRIKILTWQEFVGKFLLQDKFVIAVCGTHGKSTTSGMLGFILEKAGFDPWVLVGAKILNWNSNFRIGKSKYFIIEADEYNNNFLNYTPNIIVMTNIEWDHPDFFKNEQKLYQSFERFILQAKRPFCLLATPEGIGINNFFNFLLEKKSTRKLADFIEYSENQRLRLQIPGSFNILNASLAYAVAKKLGIQEKIIIEALKEFKGIARRFRLVGRIGGMQIFDDYAHHPREIKVTLDMAADIFPNRKIWVCFQPHTFSRTEMLFSDFVQVFKNALVEKILLLDIFPAREEDRKTVSSQKLAKAVKSTKVQYVGSISDAQVFMRKQKKKPDVLINMGAGDIFKLSQMLLKNK